MKRFFSLLLAGTFLFAVACNSGQKKAEKKETAEKKECCKEKSEECREMNALSDKEKEKGWVLLFNGENSEGWRGVNKTEFPANWIIADGVMHCKGSGQGEAGAEDGGDILYDKMFTNFHLKLDWKISEGGNSGIFYLGQEKEDWPIWKTAPEMQILDNENHIDAEMGIDGNRQAGSLYDLIPAKPQNANPAGEWNTAEVICFKGTVVHKQNGKTILEYHLWTDDWKAMVADSKFPELNEDWANVAKQGYISLQDHGDDVWFRNIKIREL